jgi:hypothetical protein
MTQVWAFQGTGNPAAAKKNARNLSGRFFKFIEPFSR